MGLLKGNANIARFVPKNRLPKSTEDSWISRLKENSFVGPAGIEDVYGWAVVGNELNTEFSFENTVVGKFVVFSLRVDSLNIPKSYLNLAVEKAVQAEESLPEVVAVSKKRRAEIKEDVLQSLMAEAHPKVKTVQICVDTQTNTVYVSNWSSSKLLDCVLSLFNQTFNTPLEYVSAYKQLEQLKGKEVAERMVDNKSRIVFFSKEDDHDSNDNVEIDLASSFLSWLSYVADVEGVHPYKGREYGVMIAEQIGLQQLVSGGEALQNTVLKTGNVVSYPEFKSALKTGKLISMVKLEAALNEESWTFSLNINKMGISGIKAPKILEGDKFQKTLARLSSFCDLFELIDSLFGSFIDFMYGTEYINTMKKMKNWAS